MDDIGTDLEAVGAGGDIVMVERDISPKEQAMYMQEVAEYAPIIKKAQETLLALNTYPTDWIAFGGKMALNAAGAERVARMFPIQISNFVCDGRQDFEDSAGKGYRYVFSCQGSLKGRVIHATGTYSTRDPFLGKADGEWKPLENINENDIRQAAHRRCQANAIRALLGIRNMPVDEWSRIMKQTGQDGTQAASNAVPFAQGSKGGIAKGDKDKQIELAALIYEIVDFGYLCTYEEGVNELVPNNSVDPDNRDEDAKICLLAMTQFPGKDGDTVKGVTSYLKLRAKRLSTTLGKTKTLWAKFKDENRD